MAPPTWVLIIVGDVPPGADNAQVRETIISATTVNLPLTQFMKGSTVILTDETPIDCLHRLAETLGASGNGVAGSRIKLT